MRIAVLGASGNTGTSLLPLLLRDPRIEHVRAVARRPPDEAWPGIEWLRADITDGDLVPVLRGMDAVVHLAWQFQPERRPGRLWAANVDGSRRVFEAAAAAGAGAMVYASSVAAYAPVPDPEAGKPRVSEDWATSGVPSSLYSREKAAIERLLDDVAARNPGMRVVRLRPGLVFKREAAAELRRTFVGPFLPNGVFRPGLIPVLPRIAGLAVQGVHTADLAEAYHQAVVREVHGAFNIAAEPVLDIDTIARALRARTVPVPAVLAKGALAAAWRLGLEPTEPGWLDLGVRLPLMDVSRARIELGWLPGRAADEALLEVIAGIRDGAGAPTPKLSPSTGGPLRIREVLSGVGLRSFD